MTRDTGPDRRELLIAGAAVTVTACSQRTAGRAVRGGETTQENGDLECGHHNRRRPGRRKTPPADDDDTDDPDDPDDTDVFEHHTDEHDTDDEGDDDDGDE